MITPDKKNWTWVLELEQLLTGDDPEFSNWDQDATADGDRYDEQDPVHHIWDVRAEADR